MEDVDEDYLNKEMSFFSFKFFNNLIGFRKDTSINNFLLVLSLSFTVGFISFLSAGSLFGFLDFNSNSYFLYLSNCFIFILAGIIFYFTKNEFKFHFKNIGKKEINNIFKSFNDEMNKLGILKNFIESLFHN